MLLYVVSQFVEMYENESTKAATLDIATKVSDFLFSIPCSFFESYETDPYRAASKRGRRVPGEEAAR